MNYVAGQNRLCTVYHKEWCVSGSAIRRGPQPQSTESSSSTQCVLDSFRDRTSLGLMPLMIQDICRLIVFPGYVAKFEPLEPS